MSDILMQSLLHNKDCAIPRYHSSETYKGFNVIKCNDQYSKQFISTCVSKLRDTFKGWNLRVVGVTQIPQTNAYDTSRNLAKSNSLEQGDKRKASSDLSSLNPPKIKREAENTMIQPKDYSKPLEQRIRKRPIPVPINQVNMEVDDVCRATAFKSLTESVHSNTKTDNRQQGSVKPTITPKDYSKPLEQRIKNRPIPAPITQVQMEVEHNSRATTFKSLAESVHSNKTIDFNSKSAKSSFLEQERRNDSPSHPLTQTTQKEIHKNSPPNEFKSLRERVFSKSNPKENYKASDSKSLHQRSSKEPSSHISRQRKIEDKFDSYFLKSRDEENFSNSPPPPAWTSEDDIHPTKMAKGSRAYYEHCLQTLEHYKHIDHLTTRQKQRKRSRERSVRIYEERNGIKRPAERNTRFYEERNDVRRPAERSVRMYDEEHNGFKIPEENPSILSQKEGFQLTVNYFETDCVLPRDRRGSRERGFDLPTGTFWPNNLDKANNFPNDFGNSREHRRAQDYSPTPRFQNDFEDAREHRRALDYSPTHNFHNDFGDRRERRTSRDHSPIHSFHNDFGDRRERKTSRDHSPIHSFHNDFGDRREQRTSRDHSPIHRFHNDFGDRRERRNSRDHSATYSFQNDFRDRREHRTSRDHSPTHSFHNEFEDPRKQRRTHDYSPTFNFQNNLGNAGENSTANENRPTNNSHNNFVVPREYGTSTDYSSIHNFRNDFGDTRKNRTNFENPSNNNSINNFADFREYGTSLDYSSFHNIRNDFGDAGENGTAFEKLHNNFADSRKHGTALEQPPINIQFNPFIGLNNAKDTWEHGTAVEDPPINNFHNNFADPREQGTALEDPPTNDHFNPFRNSSQIFIPSPPTVKNKKSNNQKNNKVKNDKVYQTDRSIKHYRRLLNFLRKMADCKAPSRRDRHYINTNKKKLGVYEKLIGLYNESMKSGSAIKKTFIKPSWNSTFYNDSSGGSRFKWQNSGNSSTAASSTSQLQTSTGQSSQLPHTSKGTVKVSEAQSSAFFPEISLKNSLNACQKQRIFDCLNLLMEEVNTVKDFDPKAIEKLQSRIKVVKKNLVNGKSSNIPGAMNSNSLAGEGDDGKKCSIVEISDDSSCSSVSTTGSTAETPAAQKALPDNEPRLCASNLPPIKSNPQLQVAIVDHNENDLKIHPDIWVKLEKDLLESMLREMEQTNNNKIGKFDAMFWQFGIKIIQCENSDSLDFIKRFVQSQEIHWTQCKFDVIPVSDLPRRSVVQVWIPPPALDDNAVLKLIKAQNAKFYSRCWTLVNSRERSNDCGKDLFISISERSLRKLKSSKGEVRFGIDRLKMILPKEKKKTQQQKGKNKLK